MTINKYQLRSSEVQEVMNKPPNAIITWGNSFIVLTILTMFFLSTKLTLPEKFFESFEIEKIMNAKSNDSTIYMELSISGKFSSSIKKGNDAYLEIEHFSKVQEERIFCKIDSVNFTGNDIHYFVLIRSQEIGNYTITENGTKLHLKEGMFGTIQIITGNKSIFNSLKNRIWHSKN